MPNELPRAHRPQEGFAQNGVWRDMSKKMFAMLAVLAVAIGAAIPTIALGGARAASTHTVVLKNIRFHPGTLSINRGDSVKWLWEDGEEHNVTFHGLHSR